MFLTRSPLSKVEISDLGRNFALLRVAINPFGAIAEMEEVNGGEKVSLPYRPWNKILQRYRFFSTLSRKLCASPWVSKGRVGAHRSGLLYTNRAEDVLGNNIAWNSCRRLHNFPRPAPSTEERVILVPAQNWQLCPAPSDPIHVPCLHHLHHSGPIRTNVGSHTMWRKSIRSKISWMLKTHFNSISVNIFPNNPSPGVFTLFFFVLRHLWNICPSSCNQIIGGHNIASGLIISSSCLQCESMSLLSSDPALVESAQEQWTD